LRCAGFWNTKLSAITNINRRYNFSNLNVSPHSAKLLLAPVIFCRGSPPRRAQLSRKKLSREKNCRLKFVCTKDCHTEKTVKTRVAVCNVVNASYFLVSLVRIKSFGYILYFLYKYFCCILNMPRKLSFGFLSQLQWLLSFCFFLY